MRSEIRASMPATWEAAEGFLSEFREWCACLPDRADRFAAELLLREALNNAVLHGSGGDVSRQVRCVARMVSGRLSITVADGGKGFDWHAARGCQAAADSCSGRGMEIFRAYATRVRFNRSGNVASMLRRLGTPRRKGMNTTTITRNEHQATVRPAGDVVASQAGELRSALRGAMADGVTQVTLDFSAVQMVDSTGLGLLISAHNSARKAGGSLSVIHASREIVELFQSMRIHQHFSVSGAPQEAL
jgi:serine/threonine-protein kinase RsbW